MDLLVGSAASVPPSPVRKLIQDAQRTRPRTEFVIENELAVFRFSRSSIWAYRFFLSACFSEAACQLVMAASFYRATHASSVDVEGLHRLIACLVRS